MNQELSKEQNPKRSFNFMPIVTLLGIAYFGFLLYQAIFINYQTNKKIDEYTESLEKAKSDQVNLQALIAYYKTDTFQELEARKKLGLKLPGEKVVKVEVPKATKTIEPDKKPLTDNGKSNLENWVDYLFNQ